MRTLTPTSRAKGDHVREMTQITPGTVSIFTMFWLRYCTSNHILPVTLNHCSQIGAFPKPRRIGLVKHAH